MRILNYAVLLLVCFVLPLTDASAADKTPLAQAQKLIKKVDQQVIRLFGLTQIIRTQVLRDAKSSKQHRHFVTVQHQSMDQIQNGLKQIGSNNYDAVQLAEYGKNLSRLQKFSSILVRGQSKARIPPLPNPHRLLQHQILFAYQDIHADLQKIYSLTPELLQAKK